MAIDDVYSKILHHMDGLDASTTFTDESGKTWTAYGTAQIDDAAYKFGQSGIFDGVGAWIDFDPVVSGFFPPTPDFTMDCWVKRNTINTVQNVCGQSNNTGGSGVHIIRFLANNTIMAVYINNTQDTYYLATSTGTIVDSNWHHLAVVRNSLSLKLYIDGINDGIRDVTGVTLYDSPDKFAIGRQGEYNANYFDGWVDEFRWSKIARWSTTFTPPLQAYGEEVKKGSAIII